MSNINVVTLVGRLVRDPESRDTPNGKVVNFTIAVNDYGDKVNFIRCVAWNKLSEVIAQYTKKGSLVGLNGRIQTGSYEGTNGKVNTFDILCNTVQFLDSKPKENESVNSSVNDSDDFDENLLPF